MYFTILTMHVLVRIYLTAWAVASHFGVHNSPDTHSITSEQYRPPSGNEPEPSESGLVGRATAPIIAVG